MFRIPLDFFSRKPNIKITDPLVITGIAFVEMDQSVCVLLFGRKMCYSF